MKNKVIRKNRSPALKAVLFLIKIPLLILGATATAHSDEEEQSNVVEDLYSQKPSLFDPRSPKH